MRQPRFSQTEFDSVSGPESLGDSDPTVLIAWAFWDAPISDSREASAEVLTTTGVLGFCGAWGLIVELKYWPQLGRLR